MKHSITILALSFLGACGVTTLEVVEDDASGSNSGSDASSAASGSGNEGAEGQSESGAGSAEDNGDGDCDPPLSSCSGECVDLETDPEHCGECTEDCDSELSCIAGECVEPCGAGCEMGTESCVDGLCICRPGLVRCGEDCVDVSRNAEHCGMCDRACEAEVCEAGDCVDSCTPPNVVCEDACTDYQSDPLNCGECENVCAFDQSCVAGDCL